AGPRRPQRRRPPRPPSPPQDPVGHLPQPRPPTGALERYTLDPLPADADDFERDLELEEVGVAREPDLGCPPQPPDFLRTDCRAWVAIAFAAPRLDLAED